MKAGRLRQGSVRQRTREELDAVVASRPIDQQPVDQLLNDLLDDLVNDFRFEVFASTS